MFSGGEGGLAHDARSSAKADRAISFWDETGKHVTMPAHLDIDLLEMPRKSRQSNELDEEEENRRAQAVYNKALGGLMNLHRDLVRSLPKTRSKSQLGARGKSEAGMRDGRRSRSHTQGRSSSVLPSLTNFDAMQHIYSQLKGLDSLRAPTGSFTGWQTAGDEDGLDSLPAVHHTPKPSKGEGTHGKNKGKRAIVESETPSSRNVQTPTVSVQVVHFGQTPTSANVQKTKIPRGRQRGPGMKSHSETRRRNDQRRQRSTSPAQMLQLQFENARNLSRSSSSEKSEVVGWNAAEAATHGVDIRL